MKKFSTLLLAAVALFMVACGGNAQKKDGQCCGGCEKKLPIALQLSEAYSSDIFVFYFAVFEKFYLHFIEIRRIRTPGLNTFKLKGVLAYLSAYPIENHRAFAIANGYLP